MVTNSNNPGNAEPKPAVKPVEKKTGSLEEQDRVIMVVSNVLLVLGCILSIAVFSLGFYTWQHFDFVASLASFFFGLVGIFITLIQWLFLRVISRNTKKLNLLLAASDKK